MKNKLFIVLFSFLILFIIVGCDKKSNNGENETFAGNYKLYKFSDESKTYTAKEIKKIKNAVITLEVMENNIMTLTTDYFDDTEDSVIQYVYDDDNNLYVNGNMVMSFEFTDGKIIIKSSNYTYTFKK